MTDSLFSTAFFSTGATSLAVRILTLDAIAGALQAADRAAICLITSTNGLTPAENDDLAAAVHMTGDPYSAGTQLSVTPGKAEARLRTAWSPTQPLYYLDRGAPPWIFSDDLTALKLLSEMLAITQIPDELFAVWTLTGLPASQFGLSPMRTPWSSLKQIPAGIDVTVDLAAQRVRYGRAPGAFWETEEVSQRQAIRLVKDAFAESVAACATGSTAVLASGGIDSSAVVGVCHALGRRPLLFTNVYPEAPETDEMAFVSVLQDAFQLDVSPIESRGSSLLALAERQARPFRGLFRADDQQVIERARSLGITCVLDGLGGDELFAVRDYPIGRLSDGQAARQLLPGSVWSQIFGKHYPLANHATLLPPFITGVDEQELLWEFKFRGLMEMGCPERVLKRIYSMMFESSFWEESRWLTDEVFGPQRVQRRHPFLGVELFRAVLSAPQGAFRRTPMLKPFQRKALRAYLPTPIANRYGGAEQTANVMFNLVASRADMTSIIDQSTLAAANPFIDAARLNSWYHEGLNPASAYDGGPVAFDGLWSTLCYDRWANDWGHRHAA